MEGPGASTEWHYRWRSLLDPSQVDEAAVRFVGEGSQAGGVVARGTQTTERYRARWSLDAADGWVTSRLLVQVEGADGWGRSLDLRRHPATGRWSAATTVTGRQPPGVPAAALDPDTDLGAAMDCDLGLCPMTNLMPIRRLGLRERDAPEQTLLMAWVEMPSLRVLASTQHYFSVDAHRVRYVSGTREVDVELTVDDHGMVTHYPGLAELTAAG